MLSRVIALVAVAALALSSARSNAHGGSLYGYLFGPDARFLKLDVETANVVSTGDLGSRPGFADVLADRAPDLPMRACCYSSVAAQFHLIIPTTQNTDGTATYRLVGVFLPGLTIGATATLSSPVSRSLNALLNPVAHELLVNYEVLSSQWTFVTDTYALPGLTHVATRRASVLRGDLEGLRSTRFTRNARIAPDGHTIIDRPEGAPEHEQYEVTRGHVQRRAVAPMPPQVQSLLTYTEGQPYYLSRPLDDHARRVLLYEVGPDGRLATGRFVTYDSDATQPVARFVVGTVKGKPVKMLAALPTGAGALIAAGTNTIVIINLTGSGPSVGEIRLDATLSAFAVDVVFADR